MVRRSGSRKGNLTCSLQEGSLVLLRNVQILTRVLLVAAAGALAHPVHQAAAQGDRPVAPAPGHGPVSGEQLRSETMDRFRRLIRPSDDEYAWRKIRWYTDFWIARQQAAAQ